MSASDPVQAHDTDQTATRVLEALADVLARGDTLASGSPAHEAVCDRVRYLRRHDLPPEAVVMDLKELARQALASHISRRLGEGGNPDREAAEKALATVSTWCIDEYFPPGRPIIERRRSIRVGETPRPEARRFRDSEGTWWRVYEQSRDERGGGPGAACLVFESDTVARRVRDYPANWQQLEDCALESLSWRR